MSNERETTEWFSESSDFRQTASTALANSDGQTLSSVKRISQIPPEDLFRLTQHLPSPTLICDTAEIDINVERIRASFPETRLCYAVKCNPHRRILQHLQSQSVGFEIASAGELDLLLSEGVPADQLVCFHTIKPCGFIRQLHESGVQVMAADSLDEIRKIAIHAPGARVMIRLDTGTIHSRLLLSGKFGCSPDMTVALLNAVRECGLQPEGITIHVGSQCEQLSDWERAVDRCIEVARAAAAIGIELRTVSLGGGLPVEYTHSVPSLPSIGKIIARLRSPEGIPACRFMIEPGRAIVASAGVLLTRVIGVAERDGLRWVYLDAGVYHGLMEKLKLAGGFVLPVRCQDPVRPVVRCILAGPTCDSIDVFPGVYELPDVREGDRLLFQVAGAYSTSIATSFNGYPAPVTILLSDLVS